MQNSYFSFGSASVEEIDSINILQASLLAMKRAILNLSVEPGMLVFRTTAAAITGPAKQPLPTSSTPAIKFKALKLHLYARFPPSQLIRFSIVLKLRIYSLLI